MRIATWNINSIRARISLLKRVAEEFSPDILCLQETKVEDGLFPVDDVKALGFPHIYFSGQKGYNGVAILSRRKLDSMDCMVMAGSNDKRHISARLPGGVMLHNFYIPAGGDIPDPQVNPAFAFKLRFVEDMTRWAQDLKAAAQKIIIVGDFNIAPLPNDVWSHKQLLKVVSHTPVEVERLEAFRKSLNWCDAGRLFHPPEQKIYSWWSYRNRDWRKSDRGRRLDHIWVTPQLKPALKACYIHKDARGWDLPSDHVPVMIDIKL